MKNWLFVVAGLAALGVTLIRTFAGGSADLDPLLAALGDNSLKGVVIINWYGPERDLCDPQHSLAAGLAPGPRKPFGDRHD